MRNYKFSRKTDLALCASAFNRIPNRKHFLSFIKDSKSLHINCNDRSYFIFDSIYYRTVERGKYYCLDEMYVFCSEDLVPCIYE